MLPFKVFLRKLISRGQALVKNSEESKVASDLLRKRVDAKVTLESK